MHANAGPSWLAPFRLHNFGVLVFPCKVYEAQPFAQTLMLQAEAVVAQWFASSEIAINLANGALTVRAPVGVQNAIVHALHDEQLSQRLLRDLTAIMPKAAESGVQVRWPYSFKAATRLQAL